MNQLLIVITSFFAIVIGLWKFFRGKNKVKKQLAEDAIKDLENAHKNKNKSDLLDGWDKSSRL